MLAKHNNLVNFKIAVTSLNSLWITYQGGNKDNPNLIDRLVDMNCALRSFGGRFNQQGCGELLGYKYFGVCR